MCLDFGLIPGATCARTRECGRRASCAGPPSPQNHRCHECSVPTAAPLNTEQAVSERSPHLPVCRRKMFPASVLLCAPLSVFFLRHHEVEYNVKNGRTCTTHSLTKTGNPPAFLRSPHLGTDLICIRFRGYQHDDIVPNLPYDACNSYILRASCRKSGSMWCLIAPNSSTSTPHMRKEYEQIQVFLVQSERACSC